VKDSVPLVKEPISMEFNIPMFTSTGLRVRYLKITDKSGYTPLKWISYGTKAGDFQFLI
jgi:AP-2 complex subunit mu-1